MITCYRITIFIYIWSLLSSRIMMYHVIGNGCQSWVGLHKSNPVTVVLHHQFILGIQLSNSLNLVVSYHILLILPIPTQSSGIRSAAVLCDGRGRKHNQISWWVEIFVIDHLSGGRTRITRSWSVTLPLFKQFFFYEILCRLMVYSCTHSVVLQ